MGRKDDLGSEILLRKGRGSGEGGLPGVWDSPGEG